MQDYLENIVSLINANLLTVFSRVEVANNKGLGISQTVQRAKDESFETLPMCLVNDEFVLCTPDDSYNLIWYHKNNSSSLSNVSNTNYGRGNGLQKDTVNMSVVVWAKSFRVGKTALELRDMFNNGLLKTLTKLQKINIGLASVNINGTGSNMNKIQVLKQELPNSEYFLSEQDIYFEFKYTIEAVLNRQCVTC